MSHLSLNQATLNINDKSVVYIILEQPLHGFVDVVNANLLHLACNVVLAAEIEHLLSLLDSTNGAASNPETACNRAMAIDILAGHQNLQKRHMQGLNLLRFHPKTATQQK